MKKNLTLLVISSSLSLGACALFKTDPEEFKTNNCNYQGAYDEGFTHGKMDIRMDSSDYQKYCSPEVKETALMGYREGFLKGSEFYRESLNKKNSPGAISSAETQVNRQNENSGWMCVYHKGERICGYHCIQSYGKTACSSRSDFKCVEQYTKIKCGVNCAYHHGEIQCELEDPNYKFFE